MNNKKTIWLIIAAIIIIALAVAGWLYFKNRKAQEITPQEAEQMEQQKIAEQMETLKSLRQEYNAQPLTEPEVKEQLQELDELRKKRPASEELTEEQIKQQMDALRELRNQ